VNFQNIKTTNIGVALLLLIALAFSAFGQNKKKKNEPSTFRFKVEAVREMAVAVRTNLYCAGYIQASSFDTSREVVGSDDEKDQNFYAQGDNLYISAGSSSGMKVGDMFSVIRPRGKFKSKFSRKKNLGVYVQEVGGVEVVEVRRDVSIVRVKTSCGVILLGDLLKRVEKRTSPMFKQRPALNIFKSSSRGVSEVQIAFSNLSNFALTTNDWKVFGYLVGRGALWFAVLTACWSMYGYFKFFYEENKKKMTAKKAVIDEKAVSQSE